MLLLVTSCGHGCGQSRQAIAEGAWDHRESLQVKSVLSSQCFELSFLVASEVAVAAGSTSIRDSPILAGMGRCHATSCHTHTSIDMVHTSAMVVQRPRGQTVAVVGAATTTWTPIVDRFPRKAKAHTQLFTCGGDGNTPKFAS